MERRLSILQRRDKDKLDEDDPDNAIPGTPHSAKLSHGKQETAQNSLEAQEESCTSSAEGKRSQLAPTEGSHHICATPSQQSKKSAKRRLKTDSDEVREGKPAKRKVQKPTHMRTSADYCGLELVVPHLPASEAVLCEDGEKEEEAIAGQFPVCYMCVPVCMFCIVCVCNACVPVCVCVCVLCVYCYLCVCCETLCVCACVYVLYCVCVMRVCLCVCVCVLCVYCYLCVCV